MRVVTCLTATVAAFAVVAASVDEYGSNTTQPTATPKVTPTPSTTSNTAKISNTTDTPKTTPPKTTGGATGDDSKSTTTTTNSSITTPPTTTNTTAPSKPPVTTPPVTTVASTPSSPVPTTTVPITTPPKTIAAFTASPGRTTSAPTTTPGATAPTPPSGQISTSDKKPSSTNSTSSSSSSSLSSTTIIATVIGVLTAVALIVVGLFVWKKRRQQDGAASTTLATSPTKHNHGTHGNVEYLELDDRTSDPTLQTATLETSHGQSTSKPGQSSIEDLLLSDPEIVAVRIPTSKLQQNERIGRGTYGKVYKGILHGKTVAIKRLAKEAVALGDDRHILEAFVAEVQMMIRLVHPNLVMLIGVAWDSDSLANLRVVFEFMERGDLRQNLVEFERHGRAKVFDKEKVGLALDIAKGLAHLHAQTPKVIHRDLKSRNILLNDQMQAKLTDFGISRRLGEYTLTMTAGIGTNLWMAPEVLMGQRYNEKADMFSFGVVLVELNTHTLPYSDAMEVSGNASGSRLSEAALLQQVALGSRRVGFIGSSRASQVVIAIGSACVDLEPKRRPTANQVVDQLTTVINQWSES